MVTNKLADKTTTHYAQPSNNPPLPPDIGLDTSSIIYQHGIYTVHSIPYEYLSYLPQRPTTWWRGRLCHQHRWRHFSSRSINMPPFTSPVPPFHPAAAIALSPSLTECNAGFAKTSSKFRGRSSGIKFTAPLAPSRENRAKAPCVSRCGAPGTGSCGTRSRVTLRRCPMLTREDGARPPMPLRIIAGPRLLARSDRRGSFRRSKRKRTDVSVFRRLLGRRFFVRSSEGKKAEGGDTSITF